MKIDRHNYEEFFILYWDSELNSSQKRTVEEFVNDNPDLKEEFRIFGETKFDPDTNIQLEAKKFLLNNSFINITNYEEQLLDYIDNELPGEKILEVEKFAEQFPAIQKELALLQKTKIQPETEIQFPDKSFLYRKEEKVKVISFYWRRLAVAAAVLLIGGFITLKIVNTKTVNVDFLAETTNSSQKENKSPAENIRVNNSSQIASTESKSTKEPVGTNSKKEVISVTSADESASTKSSLAINQRENKNNLPEEGIKTNQPDNSDAVESNTTTSPTFAYLPDSDRIEVGKVQTTNPENVNTAFNNTDVTLKSGYALNIETPPVVPVDDNDGGGIKEFLRKTTRVFERRTKIQTTTDDNKLLVGAFAVSLK